MAEGGGKMRREGSRPTRKPYDRPGARSTIREAAVNTFNSLIDYITPSYFKARDSGNATASTSASTTSVAATGSSGSAVAPSISSSASSTSSAPSSLAAVPSPIVGSSQSSLRNVNNDVSGGEGSHNGFKPRSSDAHSFGGANFSVGGGTTTSVAASLSAAAGAPLILAGTSTQARRSLWSDHALHRQSPNTGANLVSVAPPLSATSPASSAAASNTNSNSTLNASLNRSRTHNVNMSRPPSFNTSLLSAPSIVNESYKQSPFYPGKTAYGGKAAYSSPKIARRPPCAPAASSPVVKRVVTPIAQDASAGPKRVVTSATAARILETLEKITTPYGSGAATVKETTTSRSNSPSTSAFNGSIGLKSSFNSRLLSSNANPMGLATFSNPSKPTPPPTKRLCTPMTDATILKLPTVESKPAPSPASTSTPDAPPTKPVFDVAAASNNLTSTPLSATGGKMKSKRSLGGMHVSKRKLEDEEEEGRSPGPPLSDRVGLNITSMPKFDFAATTSEERSESPEICFDFASPKPPSPVGLEPASLPTTPEAFTFCTPPEAKTDGEEMEEEPAAATAATSTVNFTAGSSSGLKLKARDSPAPEAEPNEQRETLTIVAKSLKSGSVMDILGGTEATTSNLKPTAEDRRPEEEKENDDSDDILVGSSSESEDADEDDGDNDDNDEVPTSEPSGFGNLFKPTAGSWECGTCMLNNKPELDECAACQSAKPGAAPAATPAPASMGGFGTLFKPAAGSWECEICMLSNPTDADVCVACQTPKPGIGAATTVDPKDLFTIKKAPGPKWNCDTCLVHNDDNSSACVCCGTSKPSPKPGSCAPPATTPASTSTSSGVKIMAGAISSGSGFNLAPSSGTSSNFSFGVAASGPIKFGESTSTDKLGDSSSSSSTFKFGLSSTDVSKPSGGFVFGTATSSSSSNAIPIFGTSMTTSAPASMPVFGSTTATTSAENKTIVFGTASSTTTGPATSVTFGITTTSMTTAATTTTPPPATNSDQEVDEVAKSSVAPSNASDAAAALKRTAELSKKDVVGEEQNKKAPSPFTLGSAAKKTEVAEVIPKSSETPPPLFQFGAAAATTTATVTPTPSSTNLFAPSKPAPDTSAVPAAVFSFGSSAPAKPATADDPPKPVFSFSASTASKPSETQSTNLFAFASSTAPVFGAGLSASTTSLKRSAKDDESGESSAKKTSAPSFSFSAPPKTDAASSGFNFGAAAAAKGPIFSFGATNGETAAAAKPAAETNKGLFSFGAASKSDSTPAPAFPSFGAAAPSSSGSTFGTTPAFGTATATSQPTFGSGSVFGSAPAASSFQATPSFNFGTPAPAAASSGLFAFGATPAAPTETAASTNQPFLFGSAAPTPSFGADNPFNASSSTPGRKMVKAVRKIKRKT